MSFDPHLELNEELPPQKYESYSAPSNNLTDTLDEPIIDTMVPVHARRNEISDRFTTRSR